MPVSDPDTVVSSADEVNFLAVINEWPNVTGHMPAFHSHASLQRNHA